MGVPLKFDEFMDCAEHGGGGGGAHVRLEGEKLMSWVGKPPLLGPTSVAVPEKVKLPASAGNEPVIVSLKVPESDATKSISPVSGKPVATGETSMV